MNKRFLLFAFSTFLILFFVNQHFTDKKREEYEAHEKALRKSLQEERSSQPTAERVKRAEDLPLVEAFESPSSEHPLTWLVRSGKNSFLALSSEEKWKESLFVDRQKLELIQTDDHFALYSTSKEAEIVSTALPLIGMHDLQIVSIGPENRLVISHGEYDEGQLFFTGLPPETNGIALYSQGGDYLPVGVFEKASESFAPLAKLSHFAPYTHYQGDKFASKALQDEEYFVLENDTLQVVFSTLGGAIAEVNLPFKSSIDHASVILPVNFDRIIEQLFSGYPENSFFPLCPYQVINDEGEVTRQDPTHGGYYPLLRRALLKSNGLGGHAASPKYYAFNTLSEDPETSEMLYKVKRFDRSSIQFEGSFENRRIIKTYSFPSEGNEAPYCLDVSIKVEGDSRGLYVGSGVPEVELISGNPAPMIKYSTVRNGKRIIEKLSLPKVSTSMSSIQPDWISNSNGYFTLILDPLSEVGRGFQVNQIPGQVDPSRITMIDASHDLYPPSKYPGYEALIPLKRSSQPMQFRYYAGPIDHEVLTKVDTTYTNPIDGNNPSYIKTQSYQGWFSFISEPFAKFLYFIMRLFYAATHSWGISIILLTVVLRLLMYPLNAWSIKSTLKMQEIAPKLEKMKEKQKKAKDPKQAQMEMMAFYKENKINPFGGCLPLIIQMPFLFGMFDLLKSVFPLRGASFIPGWIDNLTAPDIIFSWNYPIPFIGTSLHALPILLGVVMYFQQKLKHAQNKKKGPLSEQQQQQQKMGMIMTLIFPLLFYKFPSGLNLYWLSSMLLQILQQHLMAKRALKSSPSKEIVVTPPKK